MVVYFCHDCIGVFCNKANRYNSFITKHLRQIRNTRRFQFKLSFVFTVQWFSKVVVLLTT
ncbi:hypothetical protein FAZ90_15600 [Vibrio cyclitrophicus]|nr:hypothetical protein FAZ90_15600 [Vibrio cyclitrophicus]